MELKVGNHRSLTYDQPLIPKFQITCLLTVKMIIYLVDLHQLLLSTDCNKVIN